MSLRAVVVDDDPLSREFLAEALETQGYRVDQAGTVEAGLKVLGAGDPDLVVTDLRLPDGDGLEIVRRVREVGETPVVVLTAYGTVSCAVEAMRLGAEDFLLKPVSVEQLEVVVRRVASHEELRRENKVLRARLEPAVSGGPAMVGRSGRLQACVELAHRVAATDATVLIRGESGTGKELIAALIHERSPRGQGPFIRVNCGALTESLLTSELFGHERGAFTGAVARKEGRFELARGGTLFLDEIGELPCEVQARLLRVLETGEFERVGGTRTLQADARVVAATNRDLEAGIKDGRFREDLFYRLNVVPLVLPPLRERPEDIPLLAAHFLKRYRTQHGSVATEISTAAMASLRNAEWPGNVRELANCIQRAVLVATGPVIEPGHLGLPDRAFERSAELPLGSTLEELERRLILQTLDSTGWNRTEAARILGVTPRTLSNKLKIWRLRGIVGVESGR